MSDNGGKLLSSARKKQKERFAVVGEDDGMGCIVFYKKYLDNPGKKSKPLKIPVKDFWGTKDSFIGGVYQAKFLPEEKRLSPEEAQKKLKRLQKYLRETEPKNLSAKKLVKKV